MTGLVVLAAVVLAYSLVSRRLELSAISAPMVFVAAGILASPDVLDLVELDATHGTAFHVAELTLAILLFADASRIDLRSLRGEADLPACSASACRSRLRRGWRPAPCSSRTCSSGRRRSWPRSWHRPTPRWAKPSWRAVRCLARIREALGVESGLNDGLSVPFLALFLAIAADQTVPKAGDWLGFAAEQIGLGTLIGAGVGGGGAWLAERCSERGLTTPLFEQFAVLALALLAFLLADKAGGNGFIAAFVGGMVAGRVGAVSGERIFEFTEEEGQLLSLAVFFIFGTVAISLLDHADLGIVLYAALSLTLVRMVPVALAVAGMGFRPSTVAFMGWFGPRGLASIILAFVVAEEEPDLPALGVILAAMTVTVLASVALHGLSAVPFVRSYARDVERLPPSAPELRT